jgi:hypothetical protein
MKRAVVFLHNAAARRGEKQALLFFTTGEMKNSECCLMCTAHSRQVKVSRRRHCALPDYMHKIVLFSGETFPDRFYLPIARDDDSRAARFFPDAYLCAFICVYM